MALWAHNSYDCETSFNCILGCLKQVEDIHFGGCVWNLSKNFSFEKEKFHQNWDKNHKESKLFGKNQIFYAKFEFGLFLALIW